MRRSDGWVGAWRLIRNVLDSGHGLESAARWMHGDAREFASYFAEQTMRPLSPQLRRFITLSTPIWPLDPELAVVLHGDSGPSLLHSALRDCPFMGIQQPGAPPPKANPLFVEYLIAEGKRHYPGEQRAAFKAAGDWFKHRTDWPRAAQNYVQANEVEQASELLTEKSDEIFARFGDVLLVQDDGNSLHGGPIGIQDGGPARDLIRGTFMRAPSLMRGTRKVDVDFEEFLADFGRDDLQAVRNNADRWLTSEAGTALQRSTIANALAVSHLADLRLVDMQQALERATSTSVSARSPFLGAWCAVYWVFLHIERGSIVPAKQTLLAVLQDPAVRGLVRHTVSIMLAACERMLGQVDRATELISSSLDLSSRHATSDTMVLGWTTAAHCVLSTSGLEEALDLLHRAADLARRRSGDRSQYLLRLNAIHLALQAGGGANLPALHNEWDQIRSLTNRGSLGKRFDEDLRFTHGRLLLCAGQGREANAVIQPIIQRAHTARRSKRWTEAMLIRVGSAIAEENVEAACRLFWQCEQGIVGFALHQLIYDERRLLAPITESLSEQVRRPGFTASQVCLVEAIGQNNPRAFGQACVVKGGKPMMPSAVLTRKERDIMQIVASGLSNQDVGGRLGISEVTVKWHLKNIFQKLDVKSRTAAIARLAAV
jgi:LuxR family maltose regulon positive regulatory protein